MVLRAFGMHSNSSEARIAGERGKPTASTPPARETERRHLVAANKGSWRIRAGILVVGNSFINMISFLVGFFF